MLGLRKRLGFARSGRLGALMVRGRHLGPIPNMPSVRIDSLRFLASCRKKATKPGSVYLYVSIVFFSVLLFIRVTFCVLLVFVGMCSGFRLSWLSCHYLSNDWLERPPEEA